MFLNHPVSNRALGLQATTMHQWPDINLQVLNKAIPPLASQENEKAGILNTIGKHLET